MIDFLDIEYLKHGNIRQKEAFQTLESKKILQKLMEFSPILTGTIPIGIDIPESDLDIICYSKEKKKFADRVKKFFSEEKNFLIKEELINNRETVIASFNIDSFEIELFGQDVPTNLQHAYLHMCVEYRILQEKKQDFRERIIDLKLQGYKTEPAFAKLLGLGGDPYLSILNYYS